MFYLAYDPNKIRRARQEALGMARAQDQEKHQGIKIVELGYKMGGRMLTKTRAMVPDIRGKHHLRFIKEEHVFITEKPSGRYIWHFVPEDPEKPAIKVAQALHNLLVNYNSTDSLRETPPMTTQSGRGEHAHLDMLGHKLFWSICMLHTNELTICHLITSINGSTSSDWRQWSSVQAFVQGEPDAVQCMG